MEKLLREHDGYYRTPSGFCAIIPKIPSGKTADGSKYFEFKASVLGDTIRVEWPDEAPLALIDNDVAVTMVKLGYAAVPLPALIEEYNALVDEATPPTPPPVAITDPTTAPNKGKGKKPAQSEGTAGNGAETPTPEPEKTDVTFPPEGWAPHPDAEGFFYKDQEVLSEADLRAKIGA